MNLEDLKTFSRMMDILYSMYEMSQSEDWDESSTQGLIMSGAELYLEIKNNT